MICKNLTQIIFQDLSKYLHESSFYFGGCRDNFCFVRFSKSTIKGENVYLLKTCYCKNKS